MTTTCTAFFASKHAEDQHRIAGIVGMDSMVFIAATTKGRGIKAHERARFDAYDKKLRNKEYWNSVNAVENEKKKLVREQITKQKEEQKIKAERDLRLFEQARKNAEDVFQGFAPASGNDAWDD